MRRHASKGSMYLVLTMWFANFVTFSIVSVNGEAANISIHIEDSCISCSSPR